MMGKPQPVLQNVVEMHDSQGRVLVSMRSGQVKGEQFEAVLLTMLREALTIDANQRGFPDALTEYAEVRVIVRRTRLIGT